MNRSAQMLASASLVLFGIVGGAMLRDSVDLKPSAQDPSFSAVGLVASKNAQSGYTAGDYFYQLLRLLRREYVDPIKDEQKLASGAIRGMVGSLNDPRAMFYDAKQFAAYQNARAGRYEGIGADFELILSGARNARAASDNSVEQALAQVPRLVVSNVVPGGPAAKAGVKPGDRVYSVDDHWVVNTDLLTQFQQAQEDFKQKKITFTQLNSIRKDIREKTERALLPMRAWERLAVGTSGRVAIVWERGASKVTTSIARSQTTIAPFAKKSDGSLRLTFVKGADSWLASQIAGKSAVKLDLRNNIGGDFEIMRSALEKVAPKGNYGVVLTSKSSESNPVTVVGGSVKAPKLEIIVDRTTQGAAEIFALALESRGRAKLVGSKMAGDLTVTETVSLPDGAGYVLPVGEYRVKPTAAKLAMTETVEAAR